MEEENDLTIVHLKKKIMKKAIIYALSFLLSGNYLIAQETFPSKGSVGGRVFKVTNNPTVDKTDQFEISGIGPTNFTTSNTSDGTTTSFSHKLSVSVSLIAVNKSPTNNFQLHFYSPSEEIKQAANYKDGILNIYYPISLYDAIRSKLEQAFLARKKVTVKVTQKTDGYREGSLVL